MGTNVAPFQKRFHEFRVLHQKQSNEYLEGGTRAGVLHHVPLTDYVTGMELHFLCPPVTYTVICFHLTTLENICLPLIYYNE